MVPQPSLLIIVQRTPLWAWGALVYLLYIGAKATRTRTVYLPKLFIVPAILLAWKCNDLLKGAPLVPYLSCFVVGLVNGAFTARYNRITVLTRSNSITLPPEYHTLVVCLLFFSSKYLFGVLKALHPETALQYAGMEGALSGLFSGFFLGRSLYYGYRLWYEKHGKHDVLV